MMKVNNFMQNTNKNEFPKNGKFPNDLEPLHALTLLCHAVVTSESDSVVSDTLKGIYQALFILSNDESKDVTWKILANQLNQDRIYLLTVEYFQVLGMLSRNMDEEIIPKLFDCLVNYDLPSWTIEMISPFLERALVHSSLPDRLADHYFRSIVAKNSFMNIACQLLRIVSRAVLIKDYNQILNEDPDHALIVIEPILENLFSEEFLGVIVNVCSPSLSFVKKVIQVMSKYDGNPNSMIVYLYLLCSRRSISWDEETMILLIKYLSSFSLFVNPSYRKMTVLKVLEILESNIDVFSVDVYAQFKDSLDDITLIDLQEEQTENNSLHRFAEMHASNHTASEDFRSSMLLFSEDSLMKICIRIALLNNIHDIKTIEWLYNGVRETRQLKHTIKDQISISSDTLSVYELLAHFDKKVEMKLQMSMTEAQLISVLIICDRRESSKGTILQVKTGQGKSLIVIAAAFILVHKGNKVDVITSSNDLAQRDASAFRMFMEREFRIKVSHEVNDRRQYPNSHIIYGTASNFEGVYLRSNCDVNSIGTVVIIDEADNTLLDKANYYCQLSENVSGLSTTVPVLRLIWDIVSQNMKSKSKLRNNEYIDNFITTLASFIRYELDDKYIHIVPNHLRDFIYYRIPIWINSAITALRYTINREYCIDDKNFKIVSIDYINTGEWQYSMVLSNGLHQFLELKEDLPVTCESMTKSFISNYAFINKYPIVTGITGTIGYEPEQIALQNLYCVNTLKIPTIQEGNQLNIMTPWLATTDDIWMHFIYCDTMRDGSDEKAPLTLSPPCYTTRHRSVLIICLTIDDVNRLQAYFIGRGVRESDIELIICNPNNESLVVPKASEGKIIIATNLSGRGMHINSSSIECEGGLHVIVSFLTNNSRIQDQAYGRTARQQYSGSCRLILRSIELSEKHFEIVKTRLCDIPLDLSIKGLCLEYQNKRWEIISEGFYDDQHNITIATTNKLLCVVMKIGLIIIEDEGRYTDIINDDDMMVCTRRLNIETIMNYRNETENNRLLNLYTKEQKLLTKKELLYEDFRSIYNNTTLTIENDLNDVKDSITSIHQTYMKDCWGIFLDKVSKNEHHSIDDFQYEKTITNMRNSCDMFDIQYANVIVDISNKYNQAGDIYRRYLNQKDFFSAFAYYNLTFVIIKQSPQNIPQALDCLSKSLLKFQYLQQVMNQMKCSEHDKLYLVVLTMQEVIQDNQKEIETIRKKFNALNVTFTGAGSLVAKPQDASKKSNDNTAPSRQHSIPEDILYECTQLGLKGPLVFKGKGSRYTALGFALLCLAVAGYAIFTIATGGASLALGALVGWSALAGAATVGLGIAVKGLIYEDFNLTDFGIGVATGFIVGAASGLTFGLMNSFLGSVAGNMFVSTVAGLITGTLGYVVNTILHGDQLTWSGVGRAALFGVIGGIISSGFYGLVPTSDDILLSFASGAIGGFVSSLGLQVIEIMLGYRQQLSWEDILESSVMGSLHASVAAAGRQLNARNTSTIATLENTGEQQSKVGTSSSGNMIEKLKNQVLRGGTEGERRNALNLLNRELMKHGEQPMHFSDFADTHVHQQQTVSNQNQRNDYHTQELAINPNAVELEIVPVGGRQNIPRVRQNAPPNMNYQLDRTRLHQNNDPDMDKSRILRPRSRSVDDHYNEPRQRILFEEGTAWTNHPPATIERDELSVKRRQFNEAFKELRKLEEASPRNRYLISQARLVVSNRLQDLKESQLKYHRAREAAREMFPVIGNTGGLQLDRRASRIPVRTIPDEAARKEFYRLLDNPTLVGSTNEQGIKRIGQAASGRDMYELKILSRNGDMRVFGTANDGTLVFDRFVPNGHSNHAIRNYRDNH